MTRASASPTSGSDGRSAPLQEGLVRTIFEDLLKEDGVRDLVDRAPNCGE
jgi:hypothetical protein